MYRYVGIYVCMYVSYVYTHAHTRTHTNDTADLIRKNPYLKILNQGGKKKKNSGPKRGTL